MRDFRLHLILIQKPNAPLESYFGLQFLKGYPVETIHPHDDSKEKTGLSLVPPLLKRSALNWRCQIQIKSGRKLYQKLAMVAKAFHILFDGFTGANISKKMWLLCGLQLVMNGLSSFKEVRIGRSLSNGTCVGLKVFAAQIKISEVHRKKDSEQNSWIKNFIIDFFGCIYDDKS